MWLAARRLRPRTSGAWGPGVSLGFKTGFWPTTCVDSLHSQTACGAAWSHGGYPHGGAAPPLIKMFRSSCCTSPARSGKFTWRVRNFELFREMIRAQKIMSPPFPAGDCALSFCCAAPCAQRQVHVARAELRAVPGDDPRAEDHGAALPCRRCALSCCCAPPCAQRQVHVARAQLRAVPGDDPRAEDHVAALPGRRLRAKLLLRSPLRAAASSRGACATSSCSGR